MVAADKAYNSEDSHILVTEQLDAFTVNPTRHKERYPNMEQMEDTENKQMKIGIQKYCTVKGTRMNHNFCNKTAVRGAPDVYIG
jgi:hypothetical protein